MAASSKKRRARKGAKRVGRRTKDHKIARRAM